MNVSDCSALRRLMLCCAVVAFGGAGAHAKSDSETAAEAACFERVQGTVAWNQDGATQWVPENIRVFCEGVRNTDHLIACFADQVAKGAEWEPAVETCKAGQQPVVESFEKWPDPENPDRKLSAIFVVTCYTGGAPDRRQSDLTTISQSLGGRLVSSQTTSEDCNIVKVRDVPD